MRWWPWTRIRELERERDQLAFTCEGWADRHDRLAERYDALVRDLLALKRDGFYQPPQPSHKRTTQPLPPELATFLAGFPPGPIADANEKAIRAALAKGTPVAEIIKHVKEVSG